MSKSCSCGCCQGLETKTLNTITNRPGLPSLSYRVGTQASFLETMKAQLANFYLPVLPNEGNFLFSPDDFKDLAGLRARLETAKDELSKYLAQDLTDHQGGEHHDPQHGKGHEDTGHHDTGHEDTKHHDSKAGVPHHSQTEPANPALPEGAALVQGLNRLLAQGQVLYSRERFARVNLSQNSRDLLALYRRDPESLGLVGLVYLNRRLLEDAYPRQILRNGLDYPLQKLTTRRADDFTIALLDGWATVGDVLSFYQERIANEGYLRTATERRSVLELARLIGYKLRPGVSSTVYLAYTLEKDSVSVIPAGSKSQSLPAAGGLPQTFETAEPLPARAVWNGFKPRLTQPQIITEFTGQVYFKGIATNLRPGDGLLLDFGATAPKQFRKVKKVTPDAPNDRTLVTFEGFEPETAPAQKIVSGISALLDQLSQPPTDHPLDRQHLELDPAQLQQPGSDLFARLLLNSRPELRPVLYGAWQNAQVTPSVAARIYALRLKAGVFGNNAPKRVILPAPDTGGEVTFKEWDLVESGAGPAGTFVVKIDYPVIHSGSGSQTTGMNVQISLDGKEPTSNQPFVLNGDNQHFKIEYSAANEVINITVQPITVGNNRLFELTFEFINRKFSLTVTLDRSGLFPITIEDGTITKVDIQQPTVIEGPAQPMTLTITGKGGTTGTEAPGVIWLDANYDQFTAGNNSWIVIDRPDTVALNVPVIDTIAKVTLASRADYGISAKSTRLELAKKPWLSIGGNNGDDFSAIRNTTVYAQSEELELAEEKLDPLKSSLCGGVIELDTLYDGLETGRWLIVSGERADIPGTTGVKAAELVMLAGVEQGVQLLKDRLGGAVRAGGNSVTDSLSTTGGQGEAVVPGDKTHTYLTLHKALAYCYKLDTVTVYGNVVKATHGETRDEILGSGDATKALQSFKLRQFPLTFVPANNPKGVNSTLKLYVNGVRWDEVDSLAGLKPDDRAFVTETDDENKTTATFGNGVEGARLPTGADNIRAIYRNGIGKPGNVEAGQINLLVSRPAGVKDVLNPLPATGGADRESRDRAKVNAPLAVLALDRLVSAQDYEDFARTFAGIGKASARRLSDGQHQPIHVTIAGEDDIPIAPDSDLFKNLRQALLTYGDPYLRVQLAVRELLALFISAKVRINSDRYLWDNISTQIRTKLLDKFSFEQRELGQPVRLSQVISLIQAVPGVVYVDVDEFKTLGDADIKARLDKPKAGADGTPAPVPEPEPQVLPKATLEVNLAHFDKDTKAIVPAQLAYLLPDVSDTLILQELK